MPKKTFDIPGEESDYESSFTPYGGPEPKNNTVYRVAVDGCWLKSTDSGDDRVVFLLKVTEDPAKQKRYAGAPFWEGVNMSQKSYWKYVEFLKALGIPFKQGKTIVTGKVENEKLGEPIMKIGAVKVVGQELLIKTGMGKDASGTPQVVAKVIMPLAEDEADEDAEDEDAEDAADDDTDEDGDEPPF